MVGKKVKIYSENGSFFSDGIITKFERDKVYIKYLGEYERNNYGYFEFDIVFDYLNAINNKRIVLYQD